MTVSLDFPGTTLQLTEATCVVRSQRLLTTLASTIVGGGMSQARVLLNASVGADYVGIDPVGDVRAFAAQQQIAEPLVGMLTGVAMRHVRSLTLRDDGVTVAVIITAGTSNAIAAGISSPVATTGVGTINMMVLIDAALAPGALVNLVMTATEAKTAVLRDAGICAPTGEPATGTSTDALVIACTNQGAPYPYGGPITPVGSLVARAVRQCLAETLRHD